MKKKIFHPKIGKFGTSNLFFKKEKHIFLVLILGYVKGERKGKRKI